MNASVYPSGAIWRFDVTTPASIDSSYQPSAETGWPTSYAKTGTNTGTASGTLVLHVFYEWDGTNKARYTVSGTAPTTAHGHLVPAGATVPAAGTATEIVIYGQDNVVNFKTVGTASGIKVTFYLEVCVDR